MILVLSTDTSFGDVWIAPRKRSRTLPCAERRLLSPNGEGKPSILFSVLRSGRFSEFFGIPGSTGLPKQYFQLRSPVHLDGDLRSSSAHHG
ncbi:uncharacterized protein LAJ45_08669 [Morchella importuna]|uniref:uncharacterized protein n=1 Tax=Morchella importuna TaxID=1174673 RepID=UPI001E8ECDDC|nr:uncharacterized protein LAJ45_08669 [Morchella importuna]KAH8147191.1 hypothetical protein LAJ45_08669 [Morchella importuna]